MGQPRKEIPIQLRDLIIQDWKGESSVKLSMGKISEKFKIPKSTVQRTIQRYRETGGLQTKKRTGRKKILTPREEIKLVRKVQRNPFLSAPKLAAQIVQESGKTLHPSTVRKIINKNGLHGRIPRKKPYISKVNRKKRLAFARKYVLKPPSFWSSILWSDETKVNIFGSDGHQKVWRRPKEALKNSNLRPTVKHGGGSVMVWGCFGAKGVGNLEFIEGNMTGVSYTGILNRNLFESGRKVGLGRRFTFQQDNDPKHTSKVAKEFFKINKVKVLDWCPQSPDLNPIEHLWDVTKREVGKTNVKNKSELKTRIREVWDNLDPEVIRKLVSSMPKRLEQVISANGGHTKY